MSKVKPDDSHNYSQYQKNLQKAKSLGFKGANASNFALNETSKDLQYDAGELPEITVIPGVKRKYITDNGTKNIHFAPHTEASKESDLSKVTAGAIGIPMVATTLGIVAPIAVESGVGQAVSTAMNNPWVQGAFSVDGIRNAISNNGIQKTYRIGKDIYENGLTGRKSFNFVKSATGDVLDIAGGLGTTKRIGTKVLDWRFKNIILPEHQKGIQFLNKEIIPKRLGRSLNKTELSNSLNKDVDRYHLFGKDRTPIKDWIMTIGYASTDGKIRYNPLYSKTYYAPTAVHEGTHQIQLKGPVINDEYGLIEKNPYTKSYEEIDHFIPYKKRFISKSGEILPSDAKYDPETGEYLFREYNPKKDIRFRVDENGNFDVFTANTDNEKHINSTVHRVQGIDLHRRSIQSQAFPIRTFSLKNKDLFKLQLVPNSSDILERDATMAESLYQLSNKHNGVTGKMLDFQIQNAPDKELMKILDNKAYGSSYILNWKLNKLLGTKYPIDKFRQALLMRKSGGKINYINFFKNDRI